MIVSAPAYSVEVLRDSLQSILDRLPEGHDGRAIPAIRVLEAAILAAECRETETPTERNARLRHHNPEA